MTDYAALAKKLAPFLKPLLAGATTVSVPAHSHSYLTKAEADGRYLIGGSFDGSGLLYDGGVLAVGEGDGLLVGTDTVALRTPGTLTVSSTNAASGAHTHAITSSSSPGAAARILATDASGFVAVVKVTTPTVATASGALALAPQSGTVNLPASGVLGTASGAYTLAPATDVTLDPGGDDVFVASAARLGTDNYASQATGWRVDYAGGGDFRYLFVDEMHAKSFIADLEQALAGGQIISKSVAVLAYDFTAPAAGAAASLYVQDLPGANDMQVFQANDVVRLRTFSRSGGGLTIADCWGVVSAPSVDTGPGGVEQSVQRWTFTRSAAPNAGAMAAGTVVAAKSLALDYGTSGSGQYEVNAVDGAYGANSPYLRFLTWTTHPAADNTVALQLGKLSGLSGIGQAGEYGLYVRGKNTGDYLLASPIQGVNLVAAAGAVAITETNGIDITVSTADARSRSLSFLSGTTVYGEVAAHRTGDTQVAVRCLESDVAKEARARLDAIHSGVAGGNAVVVVGADGGSTADSVFLALNSQVGNSYGVYQGGPLSVNDWLKVNSSDAPVAALDVTGNIVGSGNATIAGTFTSTLGGAALATTVTTGSAVLSLGEGRSGSGNAYMDLVGDATYTDYGLRLWRGNGGANTTSRIIHRGTGQLSLETTEAGPLALLTTNTARVYIEAGGDVGVGTTEPSEKLHVSGNVLAQSFRATSDNGGVAGQVTWCNSTTSAISTGIGNVRTIGSTTRTNTHWIKAYIGTTIVWLPAWNDIS